MLKIVVNTRLLRKGTLDGIGWFAYNTLKKITVENPDVEFHFLFDGPVDEEFLFSKNIVPVKLFPPARHAVLNIIWFEWSVRNYLKKTNPDLFLSPDGMICLGWHGRQYGVIHDVNFVHIPQDLKWTNQKYYNHFLYKAAHKATRLGTVSQFSKDDIVNTFKIDPDKVDVLYNGINSFLAPVDEQTKQLIKAKYTGANDYFIFVGTLHPRKNILRLLQAFELFKKKTSSGMKLVLVGKEMHRTNEMHEYHCQMQFREDVIFTGYLPEDEIRKIYASALCLTFVPYFEGFGIPLIEAMQCDVPVITSNITSMPEIAGDAALMVDPYDINSIAGAMERIVQEPGLRDTLINKGRLRRLLFSWDKTADLLWDSVRKIL
jgi:glycosyltransferase involved in cell wall biosynthesis